MISADHCEKILISGEISTAHITPKYSRLPGSRYRNPLFATSGVRDMSDHLKGLHFTCQYVDCFYDFFKFKISVYKERTFLISFREVETSTNSSEHLTKRQVLLN